MSNKLTSLFFLTLLGFITTSVVWWFIALDRQSNKIYSHEIKTLYNKKERLTKKQFTYIKNKIIERKELRHLQYFIEGSLFLFFISIGVIIIYRFIFLKVKYSEIQNNINMVLIQELQRPLSTLQTNLENLRQYKEILSERKYEQTAQNSFLEIKRLREMCDNALANSAPSQNKKGVHLVRFSLSTLIDNILKRYSKHYKRFEFKKSVSKNISIKSDPKLLEIAINNILSNAIHFSTKVEKIHIDLANKRSHVELKIIDYGIGISKPEQKKVFNNFYKCPVTTVPNDGLGIGLFVTNRICKLLNIPLHLNSQIRKGTIVTFTFLEEEGKR